MGSSSRTEGPEPPDTPLPTTVDLSDNADSGQGKERLRTVRGRAGVHIHTVSGRAGVHMQSSLPEAPSPEHPLPQPVSSPRPQRKERAFNGSALHQGHTCPLDLSFSRCRLATEGLKSFPIAPHPTLSHPLRDLSGSPIRPQVYLSFVNRQPSQEPLGCSIILQPSRQTTWKEAISLRPTVIQLLPPSALETVWPKPATVTPNPPDPTPFSWFPHAHASTHSCLDLPFSRPSQRLEPDFVPSPSILSLVILSRTPPHP